MSDTKTNQDEPTTSSSAESQAQQAENVGEASASATSQTSERKKEANRENSKRSTGPKTDYGKAWTRLNALRHGFHASDVVIRYGDGKENQEEFDLLLEGLRRAWAPQDAMQECLVRTIAEADWRLRRSARAEVGEIRRLTDSYYARQSLDFFDEDGLMDSSFWSRKTVKDTVRNTTLHIVRKRLLLAQVRSMVEESGYLGEELQRTLDAEYGKDHVLAQRCHEVSQLALRQDADETNSPDIEGAGRHTASREVVEQHQNRLLRNIDVEINTLEQFLTHFEEAEDREHQATLLAHNLPSMEFVQKLTRYETTQEKRKQNAINLLMALQKKKK